jgi:hypothetical protein
VFLQDSIIFGYARYKYKLTLPLLDLIKIIAVSSFIFIVGYFVVLSTGNLLLVSVSLLVIFALVGYIIVSYSLNHSEFSVLKNMIRKK